MTSILHQAVRQFLSIWSCDLLYSIYLVNSIIFTSNSYYVTVNSKLAYKIGFLQLVKLIGASLSEPHKREVRVVGLSVCLSVCCSVRTFMTRKSTRVVLIYGVPSVVDCSV